MRFLACLLSMIAATTLAAQGVDYTDYRHHTVHFPLGDRSFADEVVSYTMGNPGPQPANARDPHAALGAPDYVDKTHSGFVSLGCGDIDAIGAIGGALQISLQSSVLFDFNESTLKPTAKQALHEAANSIRSVGAATVRVEGHTDNVGGDAVNQSSRARARTPSATTCRVPRD